MTIDEAVEERDRLRAQVAELDEWIINYLTGQPRPKVEQEDGGRIFQSDKHKAD